jgi:hypothetical protein
MQLHALLWIIAAVAVAHFTGLLGVLASDNRVGGCVSLWGR